MPTQFHKPLSPSDKYSDTTVVTTGIFANGSGTLYGYNMQYANMQPTASREYFTTVQDSTNTAYFDTAFGHLYSSGSQAYRYASEAIYKQWRNLTTYAVDRNKLLTFPNVTTSSGVMGSGALADKVIPADEAEYIYILSVKTDHLKDGISSKWNIVMTGSVGTTLTPGSGVITSSNDSWGTAAGNYAGPSGSSNQNLKLTTYETQRYPSKAGNYYKVISGSNGVPHDSSHIVTYGNFYPELGAIVFAGNKLSASLPGPTGSHGVTSSFGFAPDLATDGTACESSGNAKKLARALGIGYTNDGIGTEGSVAGQLQMRNYQYLNKTSYYCRFFHNEFNYTSNKTIMKSGSDSQISDYFTYSPVTFITEIGLYNAQNQLLAVATLNKPIKKTPSEEVSLVASIDG
jgi:hypothetical protein